MFKKGHKIRVKDNGKKYEATVKEVDPQRGVQVIWRYSNTIQWIPKDRNIERIWNKHGKLKKERKTESYSFEVVKILGQRIMKRCPQHTEPITFENLYQKDPGFTKWLRNKRKNELIHSEDYQMYLKYADTFEKMLETI